MTQQECYRHAQKKLALLEKLSENLARQMRFIKKLQMKGIKRMLTERAELIKELAMVNAALGAASGEKNSEEIKALLEVCQQKQADVIKAGNQVMQAAVFEQNRIRAKLQRIRLGRDIQNSYLKRWIPVYSNRINTRG